MTAFVIPGIVLMVLGLLVAIFNQAIGVGFCRTGKAIWNTAKDSPIDLVRSMAKDAPELYDEAKVPRFMRFMGVVSVISGIFLVVVGLVR